MYIDRNGNSFTPVEASCYSKLKKSYVVRLILSDSANFKKVIAEEPFDSKPNENQIMYCLAKHRMATFAVVEEVYTLDDDCELPFN